MHVYGSEGMGRVKGEYDKNTIIRGHSFTKSVALLTQLTTTDVRICRVGSHLCASLANELKLTCCADLGFSQINYTYYQGSTGKHSRDNGSVMKECVNHCKAYVVTSSEICEVCTLSIVHIGVM